MHPLVILADADNTLWNTDAIFAEAQLGLLDRVELALESRFNVPDKLAFLRSYDQALARSHRLGLRYPPGLLVRALEQAAQGVEPASAAKAVIDRITEGSGLTRETVDLIVSGYIDRLQAMPALLSGVREGLTIAKHANLPVWVITEGSAQRQRDRLAAHDLTELTMGIIELTKSVAQYARFRRRFADAPIVVIGDQPDRDILPAIAAGLKAILVPGAFRPQWHAPEDWNRGDHIASSFDEAIRLAIRDWHSGEKLP